MKELFVVHRHFHYDHNKPGESSSKVEKIFEDENEAYKYCVEKISVYLKEYTVIKDEFEKLYIIFKDESQTFKKRYSIVLNNFEIFFGEPVFSTQPTHDMWYITIIEI